MFPSPKEQAMLNKMRKELHSGVTPHQFGLETLKYGELRQHAAAYAAPTTDEKAPLWTHLSKTVSGWIEKAHRHLGLSVPAR